MRCECGCSIMPTEKMCRLCWRQTTNGGYEFRAKGVPGFVYFLACGDDGPIKIGHSVDPKKRLRSLQTAHHKKLSLLTWIEGSPDLEAFLHEHFSDERMRGEWFKRSPRLLDFIEDPCLGIHEINNAAYFQRPTTEIWIAFNEAWDALREGDEHKFRSNFERLYKALDEVTRLLYPSPEVPL